MKSRFGALIPLFGLLLVIALPLVGALMQSLPLSHYMEFPPLTRYVQHAGFSWPLFIGLAAFIVMVCLPFFARVLKTPYFPPASAFRLQPSNFPPWGWAGLALGVAAWVFAWNRFDWFAPLQSFTFSPLWLAYILVVNALTRWRSGRCMITHRPRYFLALFVASAAFWWFFEYLNRFVQNWYYEGVAGLTPLQYFVFATLPFSTVLPAVLGTTDLLGTFPWLTSGLDLFLPTNFVNRRWGAWTALAASCVGLAGIGVFPDYLFPLVWISPLFVITALQALSGRDTMFVPTKRGDWQRIALLALAALICGFFWEMWNFHSLAKWKYTVPFVGDFKIFEMPLLGYAGYLPFGLECAVIGDLVAGWLERREPGREE